jgi:hypothetical protein
VLPELPSWEVALLRQRAHGFDVELEQRGELVGCQHLELVNRCELVSANGRALERVDPGRRLEVLREQVGDELALRGSEPSGRAVEALGLGAREPPEEGGAIGC